MVDDLSGPDEAGDLRRPHLGQHVSLLRVQQRLANVERHRHDANKMVSLIIINWLSTRTALVDNLPDAEES